MLEGKDNLPVDAIFSFVGAFADTCLVRIEKHYKTTVHRIDTELLNVFTGSVHVYM